jgi:hypothetical protein
MKQNFTIIISFFFTILCVGQDLTINETLDYINLELDKIGIRNVYGELQPNKVYKLRLEDGYIKLKNVNTNKNTYQEQQIIHINDIQDIEISSLFSTFVQVNCFNKEQCCRWEGFQSGSVQGMMFLMIDVPDSRTGEKIKNALQYLITIAKPNISSKDPFEPKNKGTKDYSKVNINDLYVGMSKNLVFSTLKTKPVVESIESGYEVYKIKRNMDQYFLYFVNNKLTRVDRGVSIYDAIIIIN